MTNHRSTAHGAGWVRRGAPAFALLLALLALPVASAAAAAPAATYAVPLAPGAGKPTPGSGIATKAALENPRCRTEERYGPYGRFDSSIVGGGPVCTRPFKTGESNSGATAPGVTKDAIKVVYVIGSIPETRAQPAVNAATGTNGTDQDAIHDLLLPMRQSYETWGRELDVTFYTSTGTDETSQRADAVAIKALKPFAVVNSYNAGYGVMAAELAKAKILVYDAETSKSDFEAFAPYLWGSTDAQVAAINTAEVLGKQLVGKKADYAGGDVKGQARKFGLITKDGDVDVAGFKSELGKYKGKVTSEATYPASGGTYGDATLAGQFAPTIVSKMKADGVTTMVLFTDAAMNKALMEQASAQNWFPEWFHTGNSYADYQAFAATMPKEQAAHFFGISGSSPFYNVPADPPSATSGPPAKTQQAWYWGDNLGTTTGRIGNGALWLMQGIHSAGPDLTVKNFQRGQFSIPAVGGSASGAPVGAMTGYGKTVGLPYDQYNRAPADYLLMWMAPDVEGYSATGAKAKPTAFFVLAKDGFPKRYRAGTWPTKKVAWFDQSQATDSITTKWPGFPSTSSGTVCTGCPSSGAASPTVGTPNPTGFVVPVPTTSAISST